jgi:Methyltransferase domain
METVFGRFFNENVWGSHESVSGPGSSLWSTSEIRQRLPGLLAELGISSLLDAGCGDFNWMRDVPLGADYTGCDIVPELISQDNQRYANPTRRFFCFDFTTATLPEVDLILCRDCFGHFPFALIDAALDNIRRSAARYMLATTFPAWSNNAEIGRVGDWRPLNLELPPFTLPPPLSRIPELNVEDPRYPDKSLALWPL